MKDRIVGYHLNGTIKFEEYYLNSIRHRDPLEGPAVIGYYKNGTIHIQQYRVNGKFHRDPEIGPAVIDYHTSGQIEIEQYWLNDEYHNPYGPAYLDYDCNITRWYFDGVQYTNQVNDYLEKNDLKCQNMTHVDFNNMWTIIL